MKPQFQQHKPGKIVACSICGTERYYAPSALKFGGKFCSMKCMSKRQIPESRRKQISETLKRKGIKPPSRLGIPITEEAKKLLSIAHSGSNHYNWQGGITPVNLKIRRSMKYRNWRKGVFERDDFTCQICFKKGSYLHADHIKAFAIYPELRFELLNGRTLCVPCHRLTPTYGGRINLQKYEA